MKDYIQKYVYIYSLAIDRVFPRVNLEFDKKFGLYSKIQTWFKRHVVPSLFFFLLGKPDTLFLYCLLPFHA